MNFSFFTVFLKNRNISSKIKRSKVTDYAAFISKYVYKIEKLPANRLLRQMPGICQSEQTGLKHRLVNIHATPVLIRSSLKQRCFNQ